MSDLMARGIAGVVDRLVRWIVVPVTGVIPFLVSSGILLLVYAAIWLGFGWALAADHAALEGASRSIQSLALPVQGLLWLLFLPPMAGLWVWGSDWPVAVRIALIAALAAWNLLVFIPRKPQLAPAPEPRQ